VIMGTCPECGAEMVPMRIGPSTVVWFCLRCDKVRGQMPDVWAQAAEGGVEHEALEDERVA
jgi:ribosomal protein L37AE/L43A